MHQIRFRLGFCPRPPSWILVVHTSKGMEGGGKGGEDSLDLLPRKNFMATPLFRLKRKQVGRCSAASRRKEWLQLTNSCVNDKVNSQFT